MNIRDACPHCGKQVVFIHSSCPLCFADRRESPTEFERRQHHTTLTALRDFTKPRPLSESLARLIFGAILVAVLTYAGSLFERGSVLVSLAGSLLGLLLVTLLMFRRATHEDRLRWRRFWLGGLFGYWGTFCLIAIQEPWPVDVYSWPLHQVVAASVAFGVGSLALFCFDRKRPASIA